ncbi:FAD-dependent oxidoreductase [Actinomadura sp. NEAU-AAG7]|uniref:FAD-dependent oxidoreductase n=1 Tax=Actinomadura sp. NEAU-AAG7 TaxID=2839640 RepID=UPI001BE3E454|nr:FAD-binding protein [Actinomadura sp. NEAU-AAG7]MBT2207967.1 FAD-binding protein [Actinomadura sp. NEAU-AAG7]
MIEHDADVLVLGGGPAGAWAALAAATAGARVVLADKGYCGTSGPTASGGNNLWYVPPDAAEREREVDARFEQSARLADRRWMARVVDETYRRVDDLASFGYPFPVHDGVERRGSLQGPEYMKRMRRRVHRSGVLILDHHPALRLLTDSSGVVAGAAGIARQEGEAPWTVRAGAVVLATGGCAFLSGAFGTNVDTGDGHLMAAELGAELSGMEFSSVYGLSPAYGAHTKGLMMQFATYYAEDGTRIEVPDPLWARAQVAERLAAGRKVFARLDQAPAELRQAMRDAQPNYFLPLDKAGIDPFRDPYEVRMVLEGTVRGTGGLRIVGDDCATTVPGLYAAGDVATREPVSGAVSGGGAYNGAWAISSGTWAGRGAARFGLGRDRTRTIPAGRAGLTPGSLDAARVVRAVQAEILPLDRNLFRTREGLRASLASLDALWERVTSEGVAGTGRERLRARSAAAMTAHARWCYRAALAREESRGMHRLDGLPTLRSFEHRLLVGGLEETWTSTEPQEVAA